MTITTVNPSVRYELVAMIAELISGQGFPSEEARDFLTEFVSGREQAIEDMKNETQETKDYVLQVTGVESWDALVKRTESRYDAVEFILGL